MDEIPRMHAWLLRNNIHWSPVCVTLGFVEHRTLKFINNCNQYNHKPATCAINSGSCRLDGAWCCQLASHMVPVCVHGLQHQKIGNMYMCGLHNAMVLLTAVDSACSREPQSSSNAPGINRARLGKCASYVIKYCGFCQITAKTGLHRLVAGTRNHGQLWVQSGIAPNFHQIAISPITCLGFTCLICTERMRVVNFYVCAESINITVHFTLRHPLQGL